MVVEKIFPCCGSDAFRNHSGICPLMFSNLALQQHNFYLHMFFTTLNFRIHPCIALQQFDLLIHLLEQHNLHPMAC